VIHLAEALDDCRGDLVGRILLEEVICFGHFHQDVIGKVLRIRGIVEPGRNAKSFIPQTNSVGLAPSFSGTSRAVWFSSIQLRKELTAAARSGEADVARLR
jgi:hypothetical protein